MKVIDAGFAKGGLRIILHFN